MLTKPTSKERRKVMSPPRPFKTIYRRTIVGWKWLILSRYDDSEIRSGTTLTILAARAAVKQAHAELFSIQIQPRSKRIHEQRTNHSGGGPWQIRWNRRLA